MLILIRQHKTCANYQRKHLSQAVTSKDRWKVSACFSVIAGVWYVIFVVQFYKHKRFRH